MFTTEARSHQGVNLHGSSRSTPGDASSSLSRTARGLNSGAHVASLRQTSQSLVASNSVVVQRMVAEEGKLLLDEAAAGCERRKLNPWETSMITASARLLTQQNVSLDVARAKLNANLLRGELNQHVETQIDGGAETPANVSDHVAGLFHTTVAETVMRYVNPFRNENGGLPNGFEAAVQRWADIGARDIHAVITDGLSADLLKGAANPFRYMDQLGKFISANIDFGDFFGAKEAQVQNVIHFIWSGRPIAPDALANIEKWANAAKGTSWEVVLWSDFKISNWVKSKSLLERSGVKLRDVKGMVDPRLQPAYELARQGNLAGASDLIRLSLLKQYGGMYVDVDIGPGNVDLKKVQPPGRFERPKLGPGLRDEQSVRSVLEMGDDEPVTSGAVKRAAGVQRERGQGNNNFITTSANAIAMNPIINNVAEKSKSLKEADDWKNAKDFIAGISGPTAIGGTLEQMTSRGQLPQGKPSDEISDLPLEWLTTASEDQRWH